MSALLERLRCALLGEPCPAPWRAEDDEVLRRTRELADRANREADALRAGRPDRDAALLDLWGPPPWREGGGRGGV